MERFRSIRAIRVLWNVFSFFISRASHFCREPRHHVITSTAVCIHSRGPRHVVLDLSRSIHLCSRMRNKRSHQISKSHSSIATLEGRAQKHGTPEKDPIASNTGDDLRRSTAISSKPISRQGLVAAAKNILTWFGKIFLVLSFSFLAAVVFWRLRAWIPASVHHNYKTYAI